MNLTGFLDRVVAPGNYIVVALKMPGWNNLGQRFFDRDKPQDAAGYLTWAATRGDSWFAVASFRDAEPHKDKPQRLTGRRTRENAQAIKAFWADADISRPGDGKAPGSVFRDEAEVVTWVHNFTKATGIPIPNLWVKSGYGLHLYWTYEDALDIPTWHGYAETLKGALVAHGFLGDTSVVADAARILRPIDTFNYKVPGRPVPCYEFYPAKLTSPDYANLDLLSKIKALPGYNTAPLPGSGSSVNHKSATGSMAAARAGLHSSPHDFAVIAANCAQVRQSLDVGGDGDGRMLWWKFLTLSAFCEDGRDWAHKISNGHVKYTVSDTDREYDRAVNDRAVKNLGPPTCKGIDAERTGICHGCPHWNNQKSPWHVGLMASGDPNELPGSWRRDGSWIEHRVFSKDGKSFEWRRVIEGDVTDPVLDYVDGTYRLTFHYTPPNNPPRAICVDNVELNIRTAKTVLSGRGLHVNDDQAPNVCRLIMSWIDKLQRECRIRSNPMPSFGWYQEAGTVLGFSAGGTCYLSDGTEADAPGADRVLISRYRPIGDLDKWRDAAEYIGGTSAELQAVIAVAFGAPLMQLQGGAGAVLSFVGKSGCGKTSATHAGAAVWGDPVLSTFSVDDTENFKAKATAEIRSLPVYWDEAKVDDELKRLVGHIHKFTQGRDKGRLTVDTKVREVSDWSTIYSIGTNDSIRDLVSSAQGDIDATQLRILEVQVERTVSYDPQADAIVSSLRNNRGMAGQVYARYIATHSDYISNKLKQIKAVLDAKLKPSNDERFYIATIAAVVTGAGLARNLGLIHLDPSAILRVLTRAVEQARKQRRETTPRSAKEGIVARIDEFITAYSHECVVTDIMRGQGVTNKPDIKFSPTMQPKDGMGVAYHIAVTDKMIRINLRLWRHYWNTRRLPPSNLRDQAMMRWGNMAAPSRGLGMGTPYSVAKTYIFQLSLDNNELSYILEPYEPLQRNRSLAGQKVVPLRP